MIIYALIPARSGSKRIKNKNILKLNNKNLIQITIEQALKTKEINKIFVSTDSKKYQKISIDAGAEVPYLRNKKISKDLSTDLECFKDFLYQLKKRSVPIPDIIVHLRPTYPYRENKLISNCIKKFLMLKGKADSLRTIFKLKENIQKMWLINKKKMIYNPITINTEQHSIPGQKLKKSYIQANCIDILNVKKTIYKNSMTGKKIYGYEINHNYDIDDIDDFNRLKKII
ncbi:acylneuraminate cytidylyltransferase family protein [Candidatus Pelagibacter bacterium nBUS_33]|jgi:CMP-N,N'-diacetyllegionaminic acid synthase|uniref:acylneuraminate cytidylyltransferase family protein n=1 Tax=Candidatus Pelagibacter bacterium nBUS_33 TaxID=3374193 RepID=UPI003EBAE1AC